jgi:integrase
VTKAKIPQPRMRHGRGCASHEGALCKCRPTYEARLRVKGRKIGASFPTERAALAWIVRNWNERERGTLTVPSSVTLREAADQWLEGAKAGIIRTRSGDTFKPSAIRSYEASLTNKVLPELGAIPVGKITRLHLQDLADELLANGADPSTVRNHLMPARAVFRRALHRGEVASNPTSGLELPAVRGTRERTAGVEEIDRLLAAVPKGDRALWATALLAGLRLGELQALRVEDLDLNHDGCPLIRVERSWDPKEGIIAPKSRAGVRSVPVVAELRVLLLECRLATGRADGFVFGRAADRPFNPSSVYRRAFAAWGKVEGLERINMHECRHSMVTLWHGAGVSIDRIADYAGHASSGVTHRYRHPSDDRVRAEDVKLVNDYLARVRAGRVGARTGAQER